MLAANEAAWRWQPHPEVWFLVLGVVALSLYVTRVIGPKVVPAGQPVLSRRQAVCLVAGILTLWLASDWPLHDLGEEYLFSLHMTQHLLLSYVMPLLFLLATPPWLARLVVPEGSASYRWLHRLSRPLVAGLLFNGVVVFTHWPALVNKVVTNGPMHYGIHVLVVASAVLMWMPVFGPFAEWRMSSPASMAYLFAMSLLPTVPASWLIFADGSVYNVYDTPFRLWGVSVTSDQQAAGVIMKLVGGSYLWMLIGVVFFRWAYAQQSDDPVRIAHTRTPRWDPSDDALTFDAVQAAFDAAGSAPAEMDTSA
ncbi:MAG TPA: cytochrome c oxidase assembly protein [Acidimicrobiales bacterium]